MSKPDGGPAFPSTTDRVDEAHVGYPGMSLRQWYAGMALQGILASCPANMEVKEISPSCLNQWANTCFKMADAMILAREKEKQT